MPRILIKDDLDVFQPRAAIQVHHAAYAFAVFSDRVLVPGEEEQREPARRVAECMRGIGFGDQREQVTEAGGSENKIALFVRLVQETTLSSRLSQSNTLCGSLILRL